jgi:hypothetical protein
MPKIAQPFIIDIEASGFGPASYPIEVGLALEPGVKHCCLITPPESWTHWDDAAEKVHGIGRGILHLHGRPAALVALGLNEILGRATVYSDGWVVDQPWLIRLFEAAGLRQAFSISPLEAILSERQMARWHDVKQEVMRDLSLTRHRASYDAQIIQETYLRTRAEEDRELKQHA